MSEEESEKKTYAMFDRRPVSVDPRLWPVVARAKEWDNQYHSQANRTWLLLVRQHADGRAIVYGSYSTVFSGEHDAEGGEVVAPGGDVPAAIRRVAERLGFEGRLADQCTADLPAEEI